MSSDHTYIRRLNSLMEYIRRYTGNSYSLTMTNGRLWEDIYTLMVNWNKFSQRQLRLI